MLQGLTGTGPVERTDADGTWSVYTANQNLTGPLALDPRTGAFSQSSGLTGTPIEFRDPNVTVEVGLHLTGPGGTRDGGWRVILGAPSVAIRVPYLRGARLDGQGQLRADPAQPTVAFVLPALRIRVQQLAGASTAVKLLSASASGSPTENIYELIRMEPAYALIGPGDTVGFAFRSAVLDLSGSTGPDGVPATARVMPGEWQGLYLPSIRLFVSPNGVEGLALSAGARDLWIGIGVHEGVTGVFEAEVVNRGAPPRIAVEFRTPSGEHIADPGAGPVELPEHSTVLVDTFGGIAPVAITIVVDGSETRDDRAPVTTPAAGTITIRVTARDGGGHDATPREIQARRRGTAAAASAADGLVTVTPTRQDTHRIVREAVSPTTVTVRLEPRASVNWSWPGGSHTGETAEVPATSAAPVTVTATFAAAQRQTADCYFLFDHPKPSEGVAYYRNAGNTHTEPAADRDHPSASSTFRAAMERRKTLIGSGTRLTVDGYASFEGPGRDEPPDVEHNQLLSERRRAAARWILEDLGYTNVHLGDAHGHGPARDGDPIVAGGPTPGPGTSGWWLARVYADPPATPEVCTAEIRRRAPDPPRDVDPRPTPRGRPDVFRKIGVRVEFIRSTFIRGEIYGEFDIETAAEAGLARTGQPALRNGPRPPDSNDGICVFLLRLRLTEDRGAWDVTAEFRAKEADFDGIAKIDEADANQAALDILGALTIMAPLTSSATELSPAAGAVVALGSVALGASDLIHTHALILRGGELKVSDGIVGPDGATTAADSGTQVSILLDLETTFSFNLGIVRVDPAHPVTTRYKAVGVRSQWGTGASGTEYVPLPVFDPSRGYTLDVPAGALSATPPLDELLRVLGFRVSRDNPAYLEVEVGLGVDLGIVTVDTVRVRGRLDGPPLDLQVTKLAATLDIPGTIHGTGALEFTSQGFKGAFDLTIVPLNIRATAVLAVESDDSGVTGVLIGADVAFPVPLLLGNSGLGIYGFMGGVGVNYARNEPTGVAAPALAWLEAQLPRVGGVMDPTGWELTPGAYAFAAGMLVGTVDAGFTVHLKGIVVIEVPGPRLLLVMKADVLSLPPLLKSTQSATFLAVLDIDFGRGTITIGIVAAYQIERILKIRVPVTAFFNANQPEDWFVELGRYPPQDRVTVEVLDVISGSGYLMVHGNGISPPTGPPAPLVVPSGFAVAAGFHLQAVLMGSKAVGLYLEVAAGFDAILGLDPFYLGGIIYVRGELRLWIVGVSASAELTVQVGAREVDGVLVKEPYVHGEVCGSVDFFFFDVEGCVSLTIGAPTTPTPDPRDLIAGVSLISRAPASLEGTGVAGSIDGKIADAVAIGSGAEPPVVPLDAIAAIAFRNAPTGSGNIVMGAAPNGSSGAPANPWARIGDRWWRYELVSVAMNGPFLPAAGRTPSTWWAPAAQAGPAAGPTLSLLNWLPTPHSKAVPYGEALRKQVEHRWGTVCGAAAPPAHVLWTFDRQPLGSSLAGWRLDGLAWPDPPGVLRTTPVAGRLDVGEPWRLDPVLDLIQGTRPAVIVGDAVPCYDGRPGDPESPLKTWQTGQPLTFSSEVLGTGSGLADVTAQLANGGSLRDVLAIRQDSGWDPEIGDPTRRLAYDCDGRILRSPELDAATPAPFGSERDRERVGQAWSDAGFEPDPLANAIRLDVGNDGIAAVTILLLVPERAFGGDLALSIRDAKGAEHGHERVTGDHMVGPSNPLPGRWVHPARPWADPAQRAGRIAARVAAESNEGLYAALVTFPDLPHEVSQVVIGWDREAFREQTAPAFYVVAADGLLASEIRRFDWDTTTIATDRDALSNALTQPADDLALLAPGQTYTVEVTWKAASAEQDAQPAASPDPTWAAPVTQRFRFKSSTEAPKDLGPWILATAPGMDDVGVFRSDPVRIAFATQKVAALFDAYGQELRMIVHAASGHHPEPPGGGAAGGPFIIPMTAGPPFGALADPFGVKTPWHQAVLEMLEETGAGRCVPTNGSSTEIYTLTIPYDFEPLTEYLIDVHAVAKGAAADATGLVHRIGFTTSRFLDVTEFASYIAPASIEHRVVPVPAALASLADAPTGAQLDEAYQAAGLPVPQVPDYPRVQVLWSPDAVPQPVALVLESSEPLWRSRVVPTIIPAPADSPDPTHTYWAGRPADWLSIVPSPVPPAAGDQPRATITRIVKGPGGTRAIAFLGGSARGREARLDLRTAPDQLAGTGESFVTATRVSLARAPWEIDD